MFQIGKRHNKHGCRALCAFPGLHIIYFLSYSHNDTKKSFNLSHFSRIFTPVSAIIYPRIKIFFRETSRAEKKENIINLFGL